MKYLINKKTKLGPAQEVAPPEDPLYEIYHENSKFDKYISQPIFNKIGKISSDLEVLEYIAGHFKEYNHTKKIKLKKYSLGALDEKIDETFFHRRSSRNFSKKPLEFDELNKILYFSYGINGKYKIPRAKGTKYQYLRFSPSAGALYPLEIYPLILNVNNVERGLYHFNVKNNLLELLKKECSTTKLQDAFMDLDFVFESSVILFVTSIFKRTTFKYGERGYRFSLLDTGHLAQNIYLISTALNKGVCGIGGGADKKIENYLEVDGVDESLVYILIIGNKEGD